MNTICYNDVIPICAAKMFHILTLAYIDYRIVPSLFEGYQNGKLIEPPEQRLQELNIAKNCLLAGFEPAAFRLQVKKTKLISSAITKYIVMIF